MIAASDLPTAIDISSVLGLVAVGMFTAQILLGLLMSTGYNPVRHWPRRRVKIYTLHNWLGYLALSTALVHPLILLFSSTAGFHPLDIAFPVWSPTQPWQSSLGAVAFYLATFVVVTSYYRRSIGHHRWRLLHYTSYAAAVVFYLHGVLSDPMLKNQPIDFIDAEKVYVEGCAALVLAASIWRVRFGRRRHAVATAR